MAHSTLGARRAWIRLLWITLGSWAVTACSTDPSDPVAEPVATVVINFVPTGPILVGSTTQLAATALSASGGPVAGASFTWTTSDPGVATVSAGGLVSALAIGEVTITATSGAGHGSANLDVRAGGSLGPAGGTVSGENGSVSLTIPPGALSQTVNVLIRRSTDPTANGRILPGSIYEISPENTYFTQLSTLAIKYDPSGLPAGAAEAALQLYQFVPAASRWQVIPGSTVSTTTRTVTGLIGQSATFAVAVTGVERIELSGPLLGGALYAGQTGQLSAMAFDANGNSLPGRTIIWKSSDPSRATVSGGVVTAVSAGQVTITAECEGAASSTSVEVLARPVANWSQATSDWTMFQGNAMHTGFIPATLDPVIFVERWERVVIGGGALNPVSFSPGRVLVTSKTYFAVQKAAALDLASGAEQWSKDFGPIHGVHPPTVAGGAVYFTTSGHGDSYVWSLDVASGAQRFRSPYGNQWSTYYAPVVIGSELFMAGGEYDGMYSFNADTGAQRWFFNLAQYNEWTPAVRDGVVYAYTEPKLVAVDGATGTLSYEIADPSFNWLGWSHKSAPVLGAANDAFLTQSSRLVAFDLGGRRVKWEVVASFRGSVTTAGNMLYVANGGSVEARRTGDGTMAWNWSPPAGEDQEVQSTVLTNNLLFVSTTTGTWALDLLTRRTVWSHEAGGYLSLSNQGVLLIARPDGKLSAITVRQ